MGSHFRPKSHQTPLFLDDFGFLIPFLLISFPFGWTINSTDFSNLARSLAFRNASISGQLFSRRMLILQPSALFRTQRTPAFSRTSSFGNRLWHDSLLLVHTSSDDARNYSERLILLKPLKCRNFSSSHINLTYL